MASSQLPKETSSLHPNQDTSTQTPQHKTSDPDHDPEKQASEPAIESKKSVYAGLGWLDRLLVLWILLAIIIGILLGNFVDGIGSTLQRGKFVGVSVPIGTYLPETTCLPMIYMIVLYDAGFQATC